MYKCARAWAKEMALVTCKEMACSAALASPATGEGHPRKSRTDHLEVRPGKEGSVKIDFKLSRRRSAPLVWERISGLHHG